MKIKNKKSISSKKYWSILILASLFLVLPVSYLIFSKKIVAPVKTTPIKNINTSQDDSVNKLNKFVNGLFLYKKEPIIAGKIAIVIDDLGHEIRIAEKFLQMDIPISFSILPDRPYSKKIAHRANEQNRDVLLHLPMEPDNYPKENPGPGALLSGMSSKKLEEMLLRDIEAVPYLTGTNNHMGSKLTKNKKAMDIIMKKIKERNLFFLDSRTSPHSIAYEVAKENGVKALKRNIFLDNDNDIEVISQQIMKLGRTALKNGFAIGIGHPNPNTLAALQLTIPKLTKQGIKVVPVSQLIN